MTYVSARSSYAWYYDIREEWMASCLQKIPSGNESRARKEKMMKWVFQTLAIDHDWIIYVMHLWALKKLTLHFTNPLVNVALKFYVVNLTSCNFNF